MKLSILLSLFITFSTFVQTAQGAGGVTTFTKLYHELMMARKTLQVKSILDDMKLYKEFVEGGGPYFKSRNLIVSTSMWSTGGALGEPLRSGNYLKLIVHGEDKRLLDAVEEVVSAERHARILTTHDSFVQLEVRLNDISEKGLSKLLNGIYDIGQNGQITAGF